MTVAEGRATPLRVRISVAHKSVGCKTEKSVDVNVCTVALRKRKYMRTSGLQSHPFRVWNKVGSTRGRLVAVTKRASQIIRHLTVCS